MLEQLNNQLDGILLRAISMEEIRSLAPQYENNLGIVEENSDDTEAIDAAWNTFCKKILSRFDLSGPTINQLNAQKVEAGLRDNVFAMAMICAAAGDKFADLPLVAWAAFNKNQYQGYKCEIAVMRMLVNAGFDVNLPCDGKMPLHYMASWQNIPYSSPRGVRILLEAGADPNAQSSSGDNPLCYMAGNVTWTTHLQMSAYYLVNAGADPYMKAEDGACAMSLLMNGEQQAPNEMREEFIEKIKSACG